MRLIITLFSTNNFISPPVVCAKGLAKREFFRLPDVFAKIIVDGSGQHYTTKTVKGTLDPKWNDHFDLYVEQFFI